MPTFQRHQPQILFFRVRAVQDKCPLRQRIIQQLKDAELLVVEGTLYPLLTRLKNDGLLVYQWQESTQGPPRKYYALSEEGEKFLEGLNEAWGELSNTVNYLKNIKD